MAKKKTEETNDVLAALDKKYGINSEEKEKIIIPTGSIQLDRATYVGGTVLGKLYEIFGPESSGKTTITIHQMIEYQKFFPNKLVLLVDFEHAIDLNYARNIGLKTDESCWRLYQPSSLEDGYNFILDYIKSNTVSCVVIDSHSGASPQAEVDGEIGDATIGLQARLNGTFLRKLKGLLAIHNVTLFAISQMRSKIGNMMGASDGTTGGNAWKFYADARWKVWKMNDVNNSLNKTNVKIIKSKLGNPQGEAKFNILWGEGIDKIGEIVEYAADLDIIDKKGSWYAYNGNNLAQGLEKLRNLLLEDTELYNEIKNKTLEKLKDEQ